ncbi:MAG: aldehyde-activating protein [Gammaproteobacteria bacterium]
MSLQGSCHCGAVTITLDFQPVSITECNCSVCRRYGARWVHGTRRNVRVDAQPDALQFYCWGDKSIEFYHCRHCGCLTHYESTEKTEESRISLNTRMCDPTTVSELRVRLFDGADTWKFLD